MNEYIIVALTTLIATLCLLAIVHWKYGNGLLAKLFRVVMFSIAVLGNIGFVLGKQGITVESLLISSVIVCSLIIMMVVVIQKFAIEQVQMQTDAVSKIVKDMSITSREAAASAEEQASAVTQVSSAVEEIHQMSQNTASTSRDVANVAGKALSQGQEGLISVKEVLQVMDRMAQTSDFVEIVNQVAEQSNLLAFNAGIEAAKAEEYGRGFAIVASEVRNLAEQSKQAAKKIRESIQYTTKGQNAIKSTNALIIELGNVLEEASEKARQISGAAVQQSAGIKQISDAMVNLIQNGKHSALTSQQIRKAADELANITKQLTLIIHGKGREESH